MCTSIANGLILNESPLARRKELEGISRNHLPPSFALPCQRSVVRVVCFGGSLEMGRETCASIFSLLHGLHPCFTSPWLFYPALRVGVCALAQPMRTATPSPPRLRLRASLVPVFRVLTASGDTRQRDVGEMEKWRNPCRIDWRSSRSATAICPEPFYRHHAVCNRGSRERWQDMNQTPSDRSGM